MNQARVKVLSDQQLALEGETEVHNAVNGENTNLIGCVSIVHPLEERKNLLIQCLNTEGLH